MDLDDDLKLTPTSFGHLVRGLFNQPHGAVVGLVKLKRDPFNQWRQVDVVNHRLEEHRPFVSMVGRGVGFPHLRCEFDGAIAVDYWDRDADVFESSIHGVVGDVCGGKIGIMGVREVVAGVFAARKNRGEEKCDFYRYRESNRRELSGKLRVRGIEEKM